MSLKEVFVRHVSRSIIVCLTMVLFACAGKKPPAPEVPKPPVPPHAPLAWLSPEDHLVGRVELAPFRSTPLWSLWQSAKEDAEKRGTLVDPDQVERAVFSGADRGDNQASFVAALNGNFGEGSVASRAAQRNIVPEQAGLLTFYRVDDAAFAQVYPDLVLVCSHDRIEALGARASEGDAVPVKDAALYRVLSPRVHFEDGHFALLAEDPEGGAKELAQRRAERIGLALSADDIVRAGASVQVGERTRLLGAVETRGPSEAQALRDSASGLLSSLGSNVIVAMLGFRPLIKAVHVEQDDSFVKVSGELPQADLNDALNRLAGILGVALGKGEPQPVTP